MGKSGIYECTGCEYRVYRAEDADSPDNCPQCGVELKQRTVPRKGWLSE